MGSIRLPVMVTLLGFGAVGFGIVFYGVVFFVLWKFYRMFSKINDNLAGIRRAMERPRANV
jgi:hypothetical protein